MNRLSRSLLQIAIPVALLGVTGTTAAQDQAREVIGDTLLVERVQEEPANLPRRGMSMAQVEAGFGAPSDRLDPRGGQKRMADHQSLVLPGIHRLLRAQQGDRRGDEQGRRGRDWPEARRTLIR